MTAPTPSHVVTTDVATYVVVDDLITVLQAFIVGRAVDELTGLPPPDHVHVSASLRGVSPLAPGEGRRFQISEGEGGTFAVSGAVDGAFPNHGVATYTVDLTVSAPGYLETPFSVVVSAGAAFPLPVVEVNLRRRAIWLEGRVIDGSGAPVPNTAVSVVTPAGLAGLQAALSFAHAVPTQFVAMSPTPLGAPLLQWRDAFQGEPEVWLMARNNLAPGSLVRLTSQTGTDFALVASLPGPTNLNQPGRVVLSAPLSFDHRISATSVQVMTIGVPGASTTLSSAAFPGDEVLFLASSTAFSSGQVVQVNDANPSLVEWRVLFLPEASSSTPGGFYRLGPVGRTVTLRVHAVPPLLPVPPDVFYVIDYGQQDNVLNLRVS
jgi:hypothetical protein